MPRYGANRTGRWAGRIIQLQNLPQNHMDDLEEARSLVRDGNFEALEMMYDNIPNVLSELIRTSFVPKPGYKYIVSDFSAIEARVLSHLAGEQWRIDVFREGKDIYCASPGVSLQAVCDQMSRTPPWIPGLLLRADGYECGFYQKQ